ncbi:MAG TPA: hypothetical protein VLA12_22670, partial [Planctomycetaceae bacterium]|nr:hypothetical protein [Planctomycetaceae bacterium]
VGTQARLIEQTPAAPANGRIEWTLAFDRRVRGTVGLAFDVTQTRAADATSFTAPDLNVTDANRQNGVVAIEAGPEQNLSLEATSVNQVALREIDPVEMGVSSSGYVPQERIIAAYRYIRPGYTVTLAEERFERSAVPSAVCHSMSIRSLIGKSGRWQHEATIEFSAVGVQSLLVTLPRGASLWASLLDGEPIEVRKLGEDFLVPLDAGGATSRVLRLFYHNLSEPLANFGKLQQIPPRVSVEIEGETLALEVLDNRWEVFTPDHLQVVDSKGIFRGPDRDVKVGWLAGLADSFRRIGGNQIISVLLFAAIAFVVLFFLDRLLRQSKDRKTPEKQNRLGKVLLGISLVFLVVCVLIALMLPQVQSAREAARTSSSKNELTQIGMAVDSSDSMAFEAGTGESILPEMSGESGADVFKRDRSEISEIKEFSRKSEETNTLKGVLDAEQQLAK